MMTAIHLKARGIDGESAAKSVEAALKQLAGVARVAVVRPIGLVSVMFDERCVRSDQVLRTVCATGIDARLYRQ